MFKQVNSCISSSRLLYLFRRAGQEIARRKKKKRLRTTPEKRQPALESREARRDSFEATSPPWTYSTSVTPRPRQCANEVVFCIAPVCEHILAHVRVSVCTRLLAVPSSLKWFTNSQCFAIAYPIISDWQERSVQSKVGCGARGCLLICFGCLVWLQMARESCNINIMRRGSAVANTFISHEASGKITFKRTSSLYHPWLTIYLSIRFAWPEKMHNLTLIFFLDECD